MGSSDFGTLYWSLKQVRTVKTILDQTHMPFGQDDALEFRTSLNIGPWGTLPPLMNVLIFVYP